MAVLLVIWINQKKFVENTTYVWQSNESDEIMEGVDPPLDYMKFDPQKKKPPSDILNIFNNFFDCLREDD